MILLVETVATATGIGEVMDHLFKSDENSQATVVQGDPEKAKDWLDEAKIYDRKNAIVMLTITSHEDLPWDVVRQKVLPNFCREFPPLTPDKAVVWRHDSDREDPSACAWHFHAIWAGFEEKTGRPVNIDQWRPRVEKVARRLEHELGFRLLKGGYHKAVLNFLRAEGDDDAADALDMAHPASSDTRPLPHRRAVSKSLKQMVGRQVNDAWHLTTTAEAFLAEIEKHGLRLERGERANAAWLIYRGSKMVGRLAGLAHTTVVDVLTRMGDPDVGRPGKVGSRKDHLATGGAPAGTEVGQAAGPSPGGISGEQDEGGRPAPARGFIEDLAQYSQRIDTACAVADDLALPPRFQLEADLEAIEAGAKEAIRKFEHLSSGIAPRAGIALAEAAVRSAKERCVGLKGDELAFARINLKAQELTAQKAHARHAEHVRRIVGDQVAGNAAKGAFQLRAVAKTREIAKAQPMTALRFGPRVLWSYVSGRMWQGHYLDASARLWDGRKNIHGQPIDDLRPADARR